MKRTVFLIISLLMIHLLFGQSVDTSPSELRPVIERFQADQALIGRFYSIPYSSESKNRFTQFYNHWLKQLNEIDFNHLSVEGKADFILFQNFLNRRLQRVNYDQKRLNEIRELIPFAEKIFKLEENRRQLKQFTNPEKDAQLLFSTSYQIDSLREILYQSFKENNFGWNKTQINRAIQVLDELSDALNHWYQFYNSYHPLFTWWMQEPYKKIQQSLKEYKETLSNILNEENVFDVIGEPLGREALMEELAYEMIPYTPEELISIAEKEMTWCIRSHPKKVLKKIMRHPSNTKPR